MQAKDTDLEPTPPTMDSVVHYLLKASLQQEMARVLHAVTQELLVLHHLALAMTIPHPDCT